MKTTVSIPLDDIIDELFDSIISEFEEAIENIRKYQPCERNRTLDVDIDELLAENRQIAHLWGIDDVRQLRPDLDDDQAWKVLQTVADRLDCNVGITCTTVDDIADELYPERRERRWQGRIDVRITDIDGYGQDEVLTRLRDMAELLAKDMPDVRAEVDAGAIRHLDSDEISSA